MIAAFFAFSAVGLAAIPLGAPPFPPTGTATGIAPAPHPPSRAEEALNLQYEARSKALQAEMLVLKKADGGKLARQHRAYLRQRVDALLASYRRELKRANKFVLTGHDAPKR